MDQGSSEQLEPAVVAAWYSAYRDRLKAFLYGVLRDSHLVDEALQGTFTQAVSHGSDVAEGAVEAWLFRVAYNEAMQLRRRQGVDARSLEKLSRIQSVSQALTPESLSLKQEQVDEVRGALESLPEEQREVVRLRVYQDLTFREIADRLQIPLGTALTRMRLAKQKLHRVLRDGHD